MKDPKTSISLELCLKLFPMVMCLDSAGRIHLVSDRLEPHLGYEWKRSTLFDLFEVEEPQLNIQPGNIIDSGHVGKLFLLSSTRLAFALRGQIIEGMYNRENVFIFVGAPWLSWLYANNHGDKILADDYPVIDSQLEYQMNLVSQRTMLGDLEKFSESLSRAKREAESANLAKTKFVRHISHEIRTPLNGLITSLRLLENENDDGRRRRLLDIANCSSNALMDLVNEVLDFSKIEEGLLVSVEEDFDLKLLVREVDAALTARAAEKGIVLRFDLEQSLYAFIRTDRRAIQRILYNLIGNAIKYSRSEHIDTRFRCQKSSGTTTLIIEVEDYGIGISENDLQYIFEPFWTAQKRESNEYSTGLGLAMVKEIVESLDGTINVESDYEQGTRFTTSIPMEFTSYSAPEVQGVDTQSCSQVALEGLVLLVDDNKINLELGEIQLRNLGLEVETAQDGVQALSAAMSGRFDLVLMDIEMPVMNGIEASRKIREQSGLQGLPIIAVTANVAAEDIRLYLASGINDTLTKPFSQNGLTQMIRKFIPPSQFSSESSSAEQQLHRPELPVPILNQDDLDILLSDIGPENATRILHMFIQDSTTRLRDLLVYMAAQELEQVRKTAHRVASSALAFGLQNLGMRLRRLESSAKDGVAVKPEELREMQALFNHSIAQLRASIKSLTD